MEIMGFSVKIVIIRPGAASFSAERIPVKMQSDFCATITCARNAMTCGERILKSKRKK